MPKQTAEGPRPEIAIGPYSARQGWRVLRVAYPADHEHLLKIGAAVDVLLGGRVSRTAIPVEGVPPSGGCAR